MMLVETPTVDQRRRPSSLSRSSRASRPRCRLRRQDAHLVVDQPHIARARGIGRDSALRSAVIERVHRPLPSATVISVSPPTSTLMVASDTRDELAARVAAPLIDDAETLQPEIFRHLPSARRASSSKLRFGAVIGIAQEFALLHLFQQARRCAGRWPRRRCRPRAGATGDWSGRPGRRPGCGADCRPFPAAHARRCAGPSATAETCSPPLWAKAEAPT